MSASNVSRGAASLPVIAAVVSMAAVSFLAGERVGISVASRNAHAVADEVVAAIAHAQTQGPGEAAPAMTSEVADPAGPTADCNTDYR